MAILVNPCPLFTDLYELTMAASYFENRMFDAAVFSLFIREYPKNRGYFVAAGLADALESLENYTFTPSDLSYLKSTGLFPATFLDYLKNFRFTGTVRAMAEGTIFFKDEPILEVSAPLIEAQILETFLINTIGFQTMIATKAARCVTAAAGRPVIDFSARRTQGYDASLKVARSAYLAGFFGTSNVLAGKLYGIPVSGTMAHSYVTAFDNEIAAFEAYSKTYPKNSIFLIDTYDTLEGAKNAAKVALAMKKQEHQIIGVRLDSGDMVSLSLAVRKILDDAGLPEVKIFASSGFDEYGIADVIVKGACIDAFGVGTKMGVSADAPYLDIVYKMVRYQDRNIRKLSPGKINLPGEKQVFREIDGNGRFLGDTIGLKNEIIPDNMIPLLKTVMENCRMTERSPSLDQIRNTFFRKFSFLDEVYKTLDRVCAFPVTISDQLRGICIK
jgi:nicotinate phosphoribosyltransferase